MNGRQCTLPLVGLPGFEPGTSASRTQRAAKLRYSPWVVEQATTTGGHPTKGPSTLILKRGLLRRGAPDNDFGNATLVHGVHSQGPALKGDFVTFVRNFTELG